MAADETWDTPEKIRDAIRDFVSAIPGWKMPVAHGVVMVSAGSLGSPEVTFPVINVGTHTLPALVLAKITGRVDETATYELDHDGLARAVTMLKAAAAAVMYDHPNLTSWRVTLRRLANEPDARIFAVFVGAWDAPISSPYDKALRDQIASSEHIESPLM